jgi:lantibiotic modifying enzyme
MRAHENAGEATDLRSAATAQATTRKATNAALSPAGDSLGLCHGLAGNADILLHAARRLQGDSESAAVANAAAATLLRSIRLRSLTQPLDSPSLMVGSAGVGYFLLRLLDPHLPSVLAIGPDS